MSDVDSNALKLAKNFSTAVEIVEELNQTDLATNSNQYQDKVQTAISLLENSTLLVNDLSLFSNNEIIDDVATSNLEYLLLPALLGSLFTKITNKDRLSCLEISEIYFKDFLKRAKSYELNVDFDFDKQDEAEEVAPHFDQFQSNLQSAAIERNKKIARFKKKKQLETELFEMKSLLRNTKDEEIVRKFYLLNIAKWIETCIDELQNLKREKLILKEIKKSKSKSKSNFKESVMENKTSTFKPFIITRNEVQKKVYGLGYPSVPTLTIDQFISKKIEEGSLTIAKLEEQNSLLNWAINPDKKHLLDENEAKKQEEKIEKDDYETLKQAREWDEFKDDHKRGSGNRKNMG